MEKRSRREADKGAGDLEGQRDEDYQPLGPGRSPGGGGGGLPGPAGRSGHRSVTAVQCVSGALTGRLSRQTREVCSCLCRNVRKSAGQRNFDLGLSGPLPPEEYVSMHI